MEERVSLWQSALATLSAIYVLWDLRDVVIFAIFRVSVHVLLDNIHTLQASYEYPKPQTPWNY